MAAVLAAGTALGWGVWTEMPAPSPNILRSVKYLTRAQAWAVGDIGTVIKFESGSWHAYPTGTDRNLYSLCLAGSSEAWAVGETGTILHLKDGRWTPDPQSQRITLLDLLSVSFLNPANGWIVGGNAAMGGIVLHYDGLSWVTATITGNAVTDLAALSSDNIHFCGENRTLMRFDGNVFTPEASPLSDGAAWRGMAFPFRSLGWVVGDGGKIAKFSSGAWAMHTQGSSVTTARLNSVAMLGDAVHGYAVGAGGVRLNYDSGVFALEAQGGEDLLDIDLPNALEGSAVGGVTMGRLLMVRAATEEANLDNIRVYPNPLNPRAGRPLTVDRLPANVKTFEIATLLGEPVADLLNGISYNKVTGVVTWWPVIRGRSAAQGPYLYRIETLAGKVKKGTFLVAWK
jgi:hypothetical protein